MILGSDHDVVIPILQSDTELVVTAAISTLTCLAAFIILLRQKPQDPFVKLSIGLIISDFIYFLPKSIVAFSFLRGDFFCTAATVIVETGKCLAFAFSVIFAYSFYLVAKISDGGSVINKKIQTFFYVSIIPSVLMGLLTIVFQYIKYDPQNNDCRRPVTGHSGALDYKYIILATIPMAMATLANIVFIVWGYILSRRNPTKSTCRSLSLMLLYPGVILVCWIPIFCVATLGYFSDSGRLTQKSYNAVETLVNLQGTLDVLVYGVTAQRLRKLCSCFKFKPERASDEYLVNSADADE